jgi:hypothetical protein
MRGLLLKIDKGRNRNEESNWRGNDIQNNYPRLPERDVTSFGISRRFGEACGLHIQGPGPSREEKSEKFLDPECGEIRSSKKTIIIELPEP